MSLLNARSVVRMRTLAMITVKAPRIMRPRWPVMRYFAISPHARAHSANRQSTSATIGTSTDTALSILPDDRPPFALAPQGYDDRNRQQLHEPVAGMNRGHTDRRVLPEHRTRQNDDGKPDPQGQTEVDGAKEAGDAE